MITLAGNMAIPLAAAGHARQRDHRQSPGGTESSINDHEDLVDATMALLAPLLDGINGLRTAGRRLHPPALAAVVESAAPFGAPLGEALTQFRGQTWPPRLQPFREQMRDAAEATLQGLNALAACLDQPDQILGAYRAIRFAGRASEALYPVAQTLRPVSQFFLTDARRTDDALLDSLATADPDRPGLGVMHTENDRESRGGFSLYVPEYYAPGRHGDDGWPLVIALHGGSGHGRDFLWTWLREARSAGVLLLSPTAQTRTWSLGGPDLDSQPLNHMIDVIAARWRLDRSRILLTGMSDGGSFSLLGGLVGTVPATHLAPISASFHPSIVRAAPPQRLAGLPVYLTHGALDWMFPIDVARSAAEALRAAGVALRYREIADLSHTYPAEENPRILDWFLSAESSAGGEAV